MFLQLATLLFAIQWLGSPWQLGGTKGTQAAILFFIMVIISLLPSLIKDWDNIKNRLFFFAIIQIACLFFPPAIPIGIIINIVYFFFPVAFYKFAALGFLFFLSWLLGLNNVLGKYILTDPRGVWSGDSYFTVTDWVILVIFIVAFIRTVYHILLLTVFKDSMLSVGILGSEKTTFITVFIISAIVLFISARMEPSWQQQAINDLGTGFAAIEENNYEIAKNIAEKYYNDEKILYNGDVFYLNGLVSEKESPGFAVQYYKNAVDWYKNHDSWISPDYYEDSLYRLSLAYINDIPPDYYKAGNTIEQLVEFNPENKRYTDLQAEIKQKLTAHEKKEKSL
jgi:hypothetical protein